MAKEKLSEQNAVTTSTSDDYIYVVKSGVSYKIKKSDFQKELSSGYQGKLAIADTPTVDGYYMATETGTYTNAGSLVTDLSLGVNYINVSSTQTVFGLSVITQSIALVGEVVADNTDAVEGGKIFTAVADIYADSQVLPFTMVTGRVRDLRHFDNSVEYSTYYNSTEEIYVNGGSTINITIIQASQTVCTAYDKDGNGLAIITPNVDFVLPENTVFISMCTVAADLANAIPTVINGINTNLGDGLNDVIEAKKPNLSGNLWDSSYLIEYSKVSASTGYISAQADQSSTMPIPIEASTEYIFWDFEDYLTRIFCFYDENFAFISSVYYVSGDYDYVTEYYFGDLIAKSITTPANTAYVRFVFHNTASFTPKIDSFKIFKRSNWSILLDDLEIKRENNTYEDLVRNVKQTTHQVVDLSDKRVAILGDSLSSNGTGEQYGGWIKQFNGILRPLEIIRYVSGGATLTDTSGEYGDTYRTSGDNSLLKQAETLIYDFGLATVNEPDIIIITGGTNDWGLTSPYRYVTPTDYGSTDYDEYMETNYFSDATTGSYGTFALSTLSTIDRGKVVGAMRYLVERLGTTFPNVKFVFMTPIQSTAHQAIMQKKFRDEMLWTANRLNLPIIDQWGSAGTTMLFDYPASTTHKYLDDGIHPFTGSVINEGADVHGRFIVNEFIKKYQFFDTTY